MPRTSFIQLNIQIYVPFLCLSCTSFCLLILYLPPSICHPNPGKEGLVEETDNALR